MKVNCHDTSIANGVARVLGPVPLVGSSLYQDQLYNFRYLRRGPLLTREPDLKTRVTGLELNLEWFLHGASSQSAGPYPGPRPVPSQLLWL